jgi:class 3 adenylate cyclase
MAVMLTDLAGYTAFSSTATRADVAAAIQQQKRVIVPVIGKYQGRIVKWIGDAALCVFGSATDAVLCGRTIQASLVRHSDRVAGSMQPQIKVIVHVGDLSIDKDGDIYGDAVNVCARMEKVAQAEEVYFSDAVRLVVSRAEIPYELEGDFSFKGVSEPVRVYRTCFGSTPVLRERLVIVQTNFAHIQDAADKFGWDRIHPLAERITAGIIDAARAHGGTNRGVGITGCTLTFEGIADALQAAHEWEAKRQQAFARTALRPGLLQVRTGMHWGTVHVLKYTMMGRDIDVVRMLTPLGFGQEILLTDDGKHAADQAGVGSRFKEVQPEALRECRSRLAWQERFADHKIYVQPYMKAIRARRK